jgi:circadian clock protein KaiC
MSGTGRDPTRFKQLGTGNPELDRVLGGGFPANSMNVVMGHPGTGKTVFVEQLLFHNAKAGRPSLFLTTLSEPLAKVVTYLQRFSFFDPEALGTSVHYDDVGEDLAHEGPEIVLERLKAAIKELGPAIIVIDSFKAVHDLAESPSQLRRLISDIAGLLSAYDTTAFLVGEYSAEDIAHSSEFAVADGIVQFSRRASDVSDERFLRVLKLRGSSYLEGMHAFRITSGGLEVFPRLVSPEVPAVYEVEDERITTGVPGLDEMLSGGLRRGSGVLVVGPTGSGKTTLAVSFAAAGVEAGEPALVVHLQENPVQLAHAIRALGLNLSDLRARGLMLLYASPVELQIDSLVVQIFRMVKEMGIRRVVIDSVDELSMAATDPNRFHNYAYALLQQLAAADATTMLTMEGRTGRRPDDVRVFSLTDAILELDLALNGRAQRHLRVVKGRGIDHELNPREMVIEAGGIRVVDAGGDK